ncbi:hypothetical protein HRbin12_01217 [bacterium HR12]|nr:hypothetical protein HRbin12_01217 [bacterium HR12]
MSRWVPISEILDAYEERAASELAGRGPRGAGHVCPTCGAEFGRSASLEVHMHRAHPRRVGGRGEGRRER